MLISYVLEARPARPRHGRAGEAALGHTPITYDEVTGTGKTRITFDRVPLDKATEYAAEDADVTLAAAPRAEAAPACAERMTALYETIERPLIPVVADMEAAGVLVDRAVLADLSQRLRRSGWRSWRRRSTSSPAIPSTSARPSSWARCCSTRWGCAGGKKGKTGAYAHRRRRAGAAGRPGPRHRPEGAGLAPARQAEEHLHRQPGRSRSTRRRAASIPPSRWPSPAPGGCPRPIPTCRTSRSAPRRAARSATPSSPSRAMCCCRPTTRRSSCGCWPHMADIEALKQAFRDGNDIHAMTASPGVRRAAGRAWTARSRRKAKAINFGIIYGISGLRPGAPARHFGRARPTPTSTTYFERFSGIRAYMDRTKEFCRAQRLCHDPVRPPLPHPGIARQEPRAPPVRRARRRSTPRSRAGPPTSSSAP